MSLHLGLDLGGTNIKVCVLASADDGAPTVVHTTQGRTCADQGPTAVVERLAELAHQAISDVGDVVSMGVGVPGRFNASDGTIDFFPNLPGPWPGTPVRGLLSEADRLRNAADRHQTWVDHSWYEVVPAALGPTAGAVGAALWGLKSAASTTTIAA
jgi:predicted NBD/HSP70 family sugar kinase